MTDEARIKAHQDNLATMRRLSEPSAPPDPIVVQEAIADLKEKMED